MIGPSQPLRKRGLVVVLLGLTAAGSFAFAGWRFWPRAIAEPAPRLYAIAPAAKPPRPEQAINTPTPNAVPIVTTPADESTAAKPATASSKQPVNQATVEGKDHTPPNSLLAMMAQQLHAEAYQQFVGAKGFGGYREIPLMIVKQRPWKMPEWTSEELAKQPPLERGTQDLSLIHRLSLNRFAESNATRPSQRADAESAKKQFLWEIKSLDLVGIVMHDTPVVYESKTLPNMKDLKNKTIRDLDVFESEGLEELASGKPIYIRSKHETIRVLGPIQAAKACLKCHHDSKQGDLLGAFSYTLRVGQYEMTGRGGQNRQPFNGLRPGIQLLPKGGPPMPKSVRP